MRKKAFHWAKLAISSTFCTGFLVANFKVTKLMEKVQTIDDLKCQEFKTKAGGVLLTG